jgi:2-(1,2-epoxy-1,2-dihydrophenyl)acetyl-CoA isomerase
MTTFSSFDGHISAGLSGGVLEVVLNRPDRKNSFTDQMVRDLTSIIENAEQEIDIRVVHIRAVGSDFCSGFDLGERQASTSKPVVGSIQRRMESHVNRLIQSMCSVQKPIVVTARGWVVGLGLGIVLAADFAIVERDATLWAPFTGLGFTPDSGLSWLLPSRVGVARARRMLLLSEKVSGALANEWGMVHDSTSAEDLEETTRITVDQLASAATIALGQTKKLLHRSMSAELETQLSDEGWAMELSSRSIDFKENITARREKRTPQFKGQ